MHRLSFLLVGVILVGCPGDDGSAESGASASSDSTGAGSGTGPETSTSGDTTGSTDPPGDGTGTTGNGDASTGSSGPSPFEVCQTVCMLLVECGIEEIPNCGIPCAGIDSMIMGCEEPYVAQQQCVGALSCDEAQAWADGVGDHPCAAEDSAYYGCIGGGGSSSTG